MRKILSLFFIALSATFVFSSCTDDEFQLKNKWQLREYRYPDGTVTKVDSVFYNLQKNSFSAQCMTVNGYYIEFYGNYSLVNNELSITLLPEMMQQSDYNKFFGWPDASRTFKVEELSSSKLRLNYNDTISVFRKY